jgi:uncharacterized damage-inducible protein DinB
MTEPVAPLATFYKPGWENYQHALVQTIASLSVEQLTLSPEPQQRSIGELLEHLIGARFNWFHLWMGEGDPALDWNEDEDNDEPTGYKAASLVTMFEKSWRVISSALDRWTSTDLAQLYQPPASHQAWLRKQGLEEEPPPSQTCNISVPPWRRGKWEMHRRTLMPSSAFRVPEGSDNTATSLLNWEVMIPLARTQLPIARRVDPSGTAPPTI